MADDIQQEMTDEDAREAVSIPAIQVNTVAPMYRGDVVRLAFGESVQGFTKYHVAVAMSREMARSFAAGVVAMVTQMEQDEAEADADDASVEFAKDGE